MVVAIVLIPIAVMSVFYISRFGVVSSYYATLDDAREDRLFERGWLPPILPDSATEIRTNNDLDSNTSVGEFNLAPGDVASFTKLLDQPDVASGYAAYTNPYGVTWLFLCDAESGRCKYELPYGSFATGAE